MFFKRVSQFLTRRFSVLVEAGIKRKSIRVTVSNWLLGVIVMAVLTVLVGGAVSIGSISGCGILGLRLSYHREQNQKLMTRFTELEGSADSLRNRLVYIEQHDIQMRIMESMELIPPDARELGVGGPMAETPEMQTIRESNQDNYEHVNELSQDIDGLLRKATYQRESFTQVEARLMANQEMRNHVPAIPPTTGHISGKFGFRTDPIVGDRRMHAGVDITNKIGTPVIATADGVVCYAGWISGYGKIVKIDHGYEIKTVYAHLSAIYVEVGQQVMRYQPIAAIGNTGRTVGPHLHYEVRVAGKPVNPINYFVDQRSLGKQ